MEIPKTILNWVKWGGLGLLILALFISIQQCSKNRANLKISTQNIKALKDTVRYHKDANGNLYTEKLALLASQDELELLNKNLSDNLALLKWKYDILAGTNTTIVVKDTIKTDPVIITISKDSTYKLSFMDEYMTANLNAEYKNLTMKFKDFNYQLRLPVEAYFTKDYRVILKSKNPNIQFTDIQSFIDPSIVSLKKPKRWGLGLQIGVGGFVDIYHKNFGYGPFIGVGLDYNIFNW